MMKAALRDSRLPVLTYGQFRWRLSDVEPVPEILLLVTIGINVDPLILPIWFALSTARSERRATRVGAYRSLSSARHQATNLTTRLPTISAVT
jgi:hypothetical protein